MNPGTRPCTRPGSGRAFTERFGHAKRRRD